MGTIQRRAIEKNQAEASSSKAPKNKPTGRPKGSTKSVLMKRAQEEAREENAQKISIKITNVFKRNKEATAKIIVNRGGARSSKSFSICQLLIERMFLPFPRKILIVRKTLPALRISVLPMYLDLLSNYNVRNYIKEEKQFLNYTYGRSLTHFGSVDDPEKIKSSEWNDIWVEEATEFSYEDFVNLKLRMSAPDYGLRNQMFLSFNPTDEYHWIKTNIIDNPEEDDVLEIVSNYKDNPYLSSDYIKLIEALEKQDPNFFRIYTLGEWGRLEHVIYNNWSIVNELTPEGKEEIYGLDFGFNSPSSLNRIYVNEEEAHIEELIYKTGLTTDKLISEMKSQIPESKRQRCQIYADSADPEKIEAISTAGFWCIPAEKDVENGIDTVKRFSLKVKNNSANTIKELRSYSWKTDKNGRVTEEPVKFNDHSMDSTRYALHTHCKKWFEGRPRIRSLG